MVNGSEEKDLRNLLNDLKKILVLLMNQHTEFQERMEKIEVLLSSLSKTPEYVEKAKKVLSEKKILTKRQLLEEVGVSIRLWKAIYEELNKDPKIHIHSGGGRVETILVNINDNSLITYASNLFKSLKKDKDYSLEYISHFFNVDLEKSQAILNEAVKLFGGRIKRGTGVFKKEY